MGGLQRHGGRHRLCHRLHRGHVQASEAATKTQLKLAPGVEHHRRLGPSQAGQRGVDGLLQGVRVHAGVQDGGLHRLATMAKPQGVGHLGQSAVDNNALQLAGAGLALGEVDWLDHRQAEVARGIVGRAEVAANVGDVGVGQRAAEAQGEVGLARTGTGTGAHADIAGAKQAVHGGLQPVLQHLRIGVVNDGWAEHPLAVAFDGNLERPFGQLRVDRDGGKVQWRHIHTDECATEAHAVGVAAVGLDRDLAQAAQAGAAVAGGTQCGLQLCGAGAKGNGLALIGGPGMSPTQHKAAFGVCAAVQAEALHLCLGRRTIGQQAVVEPSAHHPDALGVDIGAGQGADKAHLITLARVGARETHVDVVGADAQALVAIEQLGVGRLQPGHVASAVARHKASVDGAAAAAGVRRLLGHQVEVLPGQRAAKTQRQRVVAVERDANLGARDLRKRRVDRRLDVGFAGVASDHTGAQTLAVMAQAQAVAMGQRITAEHHPLLLLLAHHPRLHRAHFSAGVAQPCGVDAESGNVGLGQGTGEGNVQAQRSRVGGRGVEADLDVARAHVGQASQFGLYPLGQRRTVAGVADVAGGLTVKAQAEAAAGRRLGLAQPHLQQTQVLAQQIAAKADEIAARCAAAHLDRARPAERGVEGVAQGGGVGTEFDAGGGVGLTVVVEAQGEAATALGVQGELLHLGTARATIAQGLVTERPGFADHGDAADILAGQAAHKLDQVAVPIATVAAVERDADVVGRHGASIGAEHLDIGVLQLGDGARRVFGMVGVFPGGRGDRVVHLVELEALHAEAFGEGDAVAFVGASHRAVADGAHLGAGAGLGLQGAIEGQALQLADAGHTGLGLGDGAVGDEIDAVTARRLWGGEHQRVGFVDGRLSRTDRLHRCAHRRRGLAHGLQPHLFDLVDTGVGHLGLGDRDGAGSGGERGAQALHQHAF